MLLNFCDPRLRPEIKCNTISTEGYDITNLISGNDKGFLAYSCIKPPIHIDLTFLCNIYVNYILVWPSVGPQKSSGFQLYCKNTNDNNSPYTLLCNEYLNPCDTGVLFYSVDIDPEKISVPANFLKRYISKQYLIKYSRGLRISICKTENSVPALGKIEVWGTVSPRCRKDVVANVNALWSKYQPTLVLPRNECTNNTTSTITIDNRQDKKATFEIPEGFLDAITCELMTQPITLPSGKVIDQTTLEKHEQNEAHWGRILSDPFTGIPFNEHRKPILATALKMRIDKFLLDNSDMNEIKKLPRVLGHSSTSVVAGDRKITEIPKCVLNKNFVKRTRDAKLNNKEIINNDLHIRKKHCHKLPVVVVCPKQSTAKSKIKSKQFTNSLHASTSTYNNSCSYNKDNKLEIMIDFDSPLDSNVKSLLSSIKRFSTPEKVELHNISNNCKCCIDSILYRLPCKHVICRKVLLSIENNQCKSCGLLYKSSDVERIHNSISSR